MSQAILSYLQRQSVLSQVYTERYNGYGECRKMLRKFPVTSVTSVTVGQTVIPAQPTSSPVNFNTFGWVVESWDGQLPGQPQILDLIGYEFCWGQQNCQIVYTAGYLATDTYTVVAPDTYTAAQLNGPFALDGGVTYSATGLALTKVPTGPTTGQYSVDASGDYTFAAGDNGAALLVSYSYIPQPLNQACCEMVGESYRYRTRIGEKSHTVPGAQTVAFDTSRLTPAVKMMIDQYKMVVPLI